MYTACSACKHQRRKCAPGCLLAPYFPADKPGNFRNAHRLFGIKNIMRFLKKAGPGQRDDCMKSMLFEAEARDSDPVFGSCGILQKLDVAHRLALQELERVRTELAYYRAKAEAARHGTLPQPYVVPDFSGTELPLQQWTPPTEPTTVVAPYDTGGRAAGDANVVAGSFYRYVPSGGAKIEEPKM